MSLGTRATNALTGAGVTSVGDVLELSRKKARLNSALPSVHILTQSNHSQGFCRFKVYANFCILDFDQMLLSLTAIAGEAWDFIEDIFDSMTSAMKRREGIEIRGFGSFSLHYRPPRSGRNPKTGGSVSLPGKHVPHFKPGKELRERVNASMLREQENEQS